MKVFVCLSSILAQMSSASFFFNVWMFKYFNWTDSCDRIRIKHLDQQVHEDRIFIKSVALILLERALQILQACRLFCQNFLALAALDTEDAHAKELLAGVSVSSALQRHPKWYASQKLKQDGTHRPHVIGPWLLSLAKICRIGAICICILGSLFQVLKHLRSQVLRSRG